MIATPRALIIRAPGTNCELETSIAFQSAGARVSMIHISQLISSGLKIKDYQALVFPGGFTYGDDLGAGKIMANEIRIKLGEDINRFTATGGLILGIGNGFQIMAKSGILPGNGKTVTLTDNDSGQFECRWVHLNANPGSKCVFTRGIECLYLPVANSEGKLVASEDTLDALDIALYYADSSGKQSAKYPINPSGSMRDIAGICDETGRIFALMPHPERYVNNHQHPQWTRNKPDSHCNGLQIFTNAVDWMKRL